MPERPAPTIRRSRGCSALAFARAGRGVVAVEVWSAVEWSGVAFMGNRLVHDGDVSWENQYFAST